MRTLYENLGIPSTATADEVKRAHRRGVKQHHPDKHGGDRTRFEEVQHAFEVLSDPERRAEYDRTGVDGLGKVKASVESLLVEMFLRAISEMHPDDDPIAMVRGYIRNAQMQMALQLSVAEIEREKLRTVQVRLKGGGVLAEVVQAKIAQSEAQIERSKAGRRFMDEAAKRLAAGWSYEAPMARSRPEDRPMADLLAGMRDGEQPFTRRPGR